MYIFNKRSGTKWVLLKFLMLKARDPNLPAALCTDSPPASQSLGCVLRLPPRQPGDEAKTKQHTFRNKYNPNLV